MSKSYEDYETDYQSYLSRIRSFLASTRSQSTLKECERLVEAANKCATAMQAMAEVEGNGFRTAEAKKLYQRDLTPLREEISRGLKGGGTGGEDLNREDLFYSPPNNSEFQSLATQSLIQNSEDLLLDSRAILAETEQIGMSTLTQMSTQREQMQIASDDMNTTLNTTAQARLILKKMRIKLFKSKLFLYGMILVLVFLNGLVLHLIWKKHHK
eukprot:CAMPEP_0194166582 /NCGR_PEP_ID=MMETSP0154-20130528/2144_1 /TAXON_ID=1049557 /ORGANISM="Thalassiothrix antarctica, Strain L6-D1" /LENGTH=212 /DNA_ID=CAMNT_0038877287 /DNA_START=178 /DNA_END=816 /DNA_ORIENTATION=+